MGSHKVWPLPYSGLPAVLASVSLVLLVVGLLLNLVFKADFLLIIPGIGIVLGLMSAGRKVIFGNDEVVLEYGFPRPVLKVIVRGIVAVFDVNELSRGKLVKYFKYHLVPFSLIIILPVLYIALKGKYPNPAYLPWIFLPVVIGALTMLYFMFTSASYRRLIRGLGMAAGSSIGAWAFVIACMYRKLFGTSIFSDPSSLAMAFTALLLLGISSAVLVALIGRHHVVVIEDAEGKYYAIGTIDATTAKHLIGEIVRLTATSTHLLSNDLNEVLGDGMQ